MKKAFLIIVNFLILVIAILAPLFREIHAHFIDNNVNPYIYELPDNFRLELGMKIPFECRRKEYKNNFSYNRYHFMGCKAYYRGVLYEIGWNVFGSIIYIGTTDENFRLNSKMGIGAIVEDADLIEFIIPEDWKIRRRLSDKMVTNLYKCKYSVETEKEIRFLSFTETVKYYLYFVFLIPVFACFVLSTVFIVVRKFKKLQILLNLIIYAYLFFSLLATILHEIDYGAILI